MADNAYSGVPGGRQSLFRYYCISNGSYGISLDPNGLFMNARPPARPPDLFAGGLVDYERVPWRARRSGLRTSSETLGVPGEEGAKRSAASPGCRCLARVRLARPKLHGTYVASHLPIISL